MGRMRMNLDSARRSTDDLVRALALTTQFGERNRARWGRPGDPAGRGLRHHGAVGVWQDDAAAQPVRAAAAGHGTRSACAATPSTRRRPTCCTTCSLRTGLSFQGGALLGSLTVLENVALPLRENTDLSEAVILDTARMKLDMVGLLHAEHLLPSSLSGGMKKRAAIARAIALDPDIVYFDEPSAGLDPITAAEVDNVIVSSTRCSASPWSS